MSRRGVSFSPNAWADFMHWQRADFKLLLKIAKLIDEVRQDPFAGTGKPEALKGNYQGYWSRRINKEHRLVYKVNDERVTIAGCRYHYDKR